MAVAVCLGKRQRLRVMPQQLKVKHDRGLTCQPVKRLPAVRGPCLVMLVELQSRLDSQPRQMFCLKARASIRKRDLTLGAGWGRLDSNLESQLPLGPAEEATPVRGQPPPLDPHRTMPEGSALGSNPSPSATATSLSFGRRVMTCPGQRDARACQGSGGNGLARGQKPCNRWDRESSKHH